MNVLKANKEHVRYIKENKYLTLQGAETTIITSMKDSNIVFCFIFFISLSFLSM